VNFGPGAPRRRHRRDESVASRRCCTRTACWKRSPRDRALSPCWRDDDLPGSPRRSGGSRQRASRLRHGRAARGDAGVHPARRSQAIAPLSTYPVAEGLAELRAAVAGWAGRRFGAALDPDTEVIPTFGSKEAVYGMANVLAGDLVAVPAPAYPVYERGALFAGKGVLELPLSEANGWLPDLTAVDAATWDRVALLWLNYPNNPSGRHGAARVLRRERRWRRALRLRARLRRRARRSISARRPPPRCRSPTARTCSSSTRSPALLDAGYRSASWPATG
jgi:hypothetical protein